MSGREPEWPPKEWGKELNGVGKAVSGPLAGSLEFGREARLPLNGSVSPLADFSSSARGKVLALPGMLDPMPAEEEPVEERGEQYLICLLAGYECGIKAEYVQAVERLPDVTPVPNVAHWISGVINLRGQIISIVDLRAFLGLEPQPLSPRTRLIAGRVGEMVIGLVVDGVSEMRGILGEMIQLQGIARALPAWAAPYVGGVATIGSQSVMLLDLERLLLSEKMHQYQS